MYFTLATPRARGLPWPPFFYVSLRPSFANLSRRKSLSHLPHGVLSILVTRLNRIPGLQRPLAWRLPARAVGGRQLRTVAGSRHGARASSLTQTHFPHMSHPIFPIYHKHLFLR